MAEITSEQAIDRARRDHTDSVVYINDAAVEEAQDLAKRGGQPFPFAVKDIVYTKGVHTTMASKLYQHFVPSFDATVASTINKD